MLRILKYSLVLIVIPFVSSAQTPVIDSLKAVLKTAKEDSNKVKALAMLGDKLWRVGEMDTAMILAKEGVALGEKIKYKKGLATSLATVGLIHWQKGNYPEALKFHLEALKIREAINEQKGIAACYNNIGNVYWNQERLDEALVYHKKALAIREKINDKSGQAGTYNNIGTIMIDKNDFKEAEKCFLKSVEIREGLGDKAGMATALNNLGIVYITQKKPELALSNYEKALEIRETIGDKSGIAFSLSSIGAVLFAQKKYKQARGHETRALEIAKQLGSKRQISTAYMRLARLDSVEGNFKGAYTNFRLDMMYRDSMISEANTKKSVEEAMNYEFEKKEAAAKAEQEKKDAIAEVEAHRQKLITRAVSAFGLLILIFAVFAYRSYLQKQKANKELAEKNVAIAEQKMLVEHKNLLITDSIEYAKSIQDAILPAQTLLDKQLGKENYFVLFKPKDMVSGDFYWAKPVKDKVFLAAIDCTGHGVPGAFMSLMAFNMLENIIIKKEFSNPSLILDELNGQVLSILNQQTESASAKYGMDIALIEIDRKKGKVEYAGAHNPLLIVREDMAEDNGNNGKGTLIAKAAIHKTVMTEVKADRTTIGMAQEKFTNHTVQVQKGDMLYVFTDGYPDQKGGQLNKKFFATTFKDLLQAHSQRTCAEQKETLEGTFEQWKGDNEQVDDVLVVGIRI